MSEQSSKDILLEEFHQLGMLTEEERVSVEFKFMQYHDSLIDPDSKENIVNPTYHRPFEAMQRALHTEGL